MASSSVVVLEPGVKCCSAVIVRGEGLPVGPLGLQGSVEPLHLAVLPRAVRLDELLPDPVHAADAAERVSVRPRVVGDQPLDAGDAAGGEVRDGAFEECSAGRSLLVGKDLRVREPRVVVDDGVDVVIAGSYPPLRGAAGMGSPVDPPPAAVSTGCRCSGTRRPPRARSREPVTVAADTSKPHEDVPADINMDLEQSTKSSADDHSFSQDPASVPNIWITSFIMN